MEHSVKRCTNDITIPPSNQYPCVCCLLTHCVFHLYTNPLPIPPTLTLFIYYAYVLIIIHVPGTKNITSYITNLQTLFFKANQTIF